MVLFPCQVCRGQANAGGSRSCTCAPGGGKIKGYSCEHHLSVGCAEVFTAGDAHKGRTQPDQRLRGLGALSSCEVTASTYLPTSLSSSSARREGRPVLCSSASARPMTPSVRLTAIQRSGSGSHFRDLWLTQGRLVRSESVSVIKSARVRPARLVVETPSPT